ncbi:MAG: DUF6261 family protein [Tannerellaceae bacterium]|jgi:hypothetical protein|nr:DUF6261 family protein [Tannerellaceae bacterium]
MKIIRIKSRSLHNEEWFGFYTDFEKQVSHFGKETLGIEELFTRFIPLYDKADKLLLVLRKSVYTKEMEEADKRRDELFQGFYGVVKSSQKQPDNAKQKAALRLYNLLRGYKKSVLKGNYVEESSAIYNLLQDLLGTYAADVALLALTEWVTAIDRAEQDFLASRTERKEESVAKPKEDLSQTRGQVDVLYNAMANVLEAKLLADGLGGDIVVDPDELDDDMHEEGDEAHELHGNVVYNFVIAWNETVKKYRNLLQQRAGRRAKDNESEAAES